MFTLTSKHDATENCPYSRFWKTIETGAELDNLSKTSYSTHCIGKTNVFSCI